MGHRFLCLKYRSSFAAFCSGVSGVGAGVVLGILCCYRRYTNRLKNEANFNLIGHLFFNYLQILSLCRYRLAH